MPKICRDASDSCFESEKFEPEMNVTPKVGGDQEIGVSFLIVLAETSSM